jgi:hypothetical protein
MNRQAVFCAGLTLCCVALLVVGGCDEGSGMSDLTSVDGANTTLMPIQTPQVPLEDVPIPVGFDLDERRSRYFAPGNMRFVDYFYKGSLERAKVLAFYRQEMTYAGWERVDERTSVGGTVLMEFDNGIERCEITLSKSSNLFKPTELHIMLWTAR